MERIWICHKVIYIYIYISFSISPSLSLSLTHAFFFSFGSEGKSVTLLPEFYERVYGETKSCELVWGIAQRAELCNSLINEMNRIEDERHYFRLYKSASLTWNDEDFEVKYKTLEGEIKVGRYFLKYIFDAANNGQLVDIYAPSDFLMHLFYRVMSDPSENVQNVCLFIMQKVYCKYKKEIKVVPFIGLLIHALSEHGNEKSLSLNVRGNVVNFLSCTFEEEDNIRRFLKADGITVLVGLIGYCKSLVNPSNSLLDAPTLASSSLSVSSLLDSDKLHKSLIISPEQMILYCIDIMKCLAVHRNEVDENGRIVRPVPTLKKILCKEPNINVIVQLLNSSNDTIIAEATNLLEILSSRNESGTINFFHTGLFYYLLALTPNSAIGNHSIGKLLSQVTFLFSLQYNI